MGILGIPTFGNNTNLNGVGYAGHYKSRNFTNADAVENLIRYITRTRKNENRGGDLIAYGAAGAGYYLHPVDIIQQFLFVQNVYKINQRKGRRMYHEVYNFLDSEIAMLNYDIHQLWYVGMECSQFYYQMGFQVVFAIHHEQEKRYHIHFAVNSINFNNGRKWHTSLPEIKQRERIFNEILSRHQIMVGGKADPAIYLNDGQALEAYLTGNYDAYRSDFLSDTAEISDSCRKTVPAVYFLDDSACSLRGYGVCMSVNPAR